MVGVRLRLRVDSVPPRCLLIHGYTAFRLKGLVKLKKINLAFLSLRPTGRLYHSQHFLRRRWLLSVFLVGLSDERSGSDYKKCVVQPIVSAANVPQLTADVLIASLSLARLGSFDSRHLVPVVGGKETGEHGVTAPLELFGKEGVDFFVIQQRSPVLKARHTADFSTSPTYRIFSHEKTNLSRHS